MLLEWIRRQEPSFDKQLEDYLLDKPILRTKSLSVIHYRETP